MSKQFKCKESFEGKQQAMQCEALLLWHKEVAEKLDLNKSGLIWSLKWETNLSWREHRLPPYGQTNLQTLNILISCLISRSKHPLTVLRKCLEKHPDPTSHQELATILSSEANFMSVGDPLVPAPKGTTSFEELRRMETLPLYIDIHRLLPLLNKYRLLSVREYCAIVEATKIESSIDLLLQVLERHPNGMCLLVHCLEEDGDMSSGHSALAAIISGVSKTLGSHCRDIEGFMGIYASNLKRKYREGSLIMQRQWPPQKSEKMIQLELVETEKESTRQQGPIGHAVGKEKRRPIHHANLFKRCSFSKKPIRRVLVVGEPGSGKTTLCSILVQGWGACQILQEFKVVVLFHLRDPEVCSAQRLEDLPFHASAKVQEQLVQHFYETEGEGTLFLFDGWDEVSSSQQIQGKFFQKLLSGKLLSFASVMVTSRTSSSYHLHSLPSFHRRVEILGFSEQNIKEYIFAEFSSNETGASRLVEQVLDNPVVSAVCNIPLNCAIICHLWHSMETALPTSMTTLYAKIVLNVLLREIKRNFPRHQHIKRLTDFVTLPTDLQPLWHKLQQLAYRGIIKGTIVYSEEEMGILLPYTSEDDLFNLQRFGLLQSAEHLVSLGHNFSFHFIHLTFQEFLAAQYITTLRQGQQVEIYRQYHNDPHLCITWRFFFGLLGGKGLSSSLVSTFSIHSSELQLSHCAFEAADRELCKVVLKRRRLVTFRGSFSPHDCLAIGYLIEGSAILNLDMKIGLCGHLSNRSTGMLANFLVRANGYTQVTEMQVTVGTAALPCLLEASGAFHSLHDLHLSNSPLDPSSVNVLTQLLQMHSSLEKVHLTKIGINEDVAPALIRALGRHRGIHWLRLSHNNLGDSGIQSLAQELPNLPNLKELYLSEVSTTKSIVPLINAVSQHCKSLRGLHLRGNPLSPDDGYFIGVALCNMQYDTDRLSIDGTMLGDAGMCAFTSAITKEHSIVELSLRSCNITSVGLSSLKDILCSDTLSVHKLYLDKNQLGHEGAFQISRVLESNNCTLTWISLYDCNLGTEGAFEMLCGLSRNHFLKFLHLRSNGIGENLPESHQPLCQSAISVSDEAWSIFGRCLHLPSNSTLQWVDLSSNCLTAEGIYCVAAFMYTCRSLKDLVTSNCKLTSSDLLRLSQQFSQLNSPQSSSDFSHDNLQSWDLSYNNIDGGTSSIALEQLLKMFSQLEVIHLRENPVSPVMMKHFEERLDARIRYHRDTRAKKDTMKAEEMVRFRETSGYFKSRSDFSTIDDYTHYMRANITVGMRVCSYEENRLGTIIRVDNNEMDALINWECSSSISTVNISECKLESGNFKCKSNCEMKYSLRKYFAALRAIEERNLTRLVEGIKEEHPWHWCDKCKVKPIVGPRYHCLVCEDWDFCQGCFGNEEYHNHAFERIDNNSLPPVYVGPPGSQGKAPQRDANDSNFLHDNEHDDQDEFDDEWFDAPEDQEVQTSAQGLTNAKGIQQTSQDVWTLVDDSTLDLSCFREVKKELMDVVCWFNLGIELGLPHHILRKIGVDNREKVDACMNDMLAEWLQRNYITGIDDTPSWQSLAKALASRTVKFREKARHIAKHHGKCG